jgi:hypothetical protein
MPEVTEESITAAERVRKERFEAVAAEWPVGTKIECKGGDYPGNQGVVIDVIEKAMVPYPRVRLLVYGTGRRRPEGKQPVYDMRTTSLIKIDEYKPEPQPAAPATPAPTTADGTTAAPTDGGNAEAPPAAAVETKGEMKAEELQAAEAAASEGESW